MIDMHSRAVSIDLEDDKRIRIILSYPYSSDNEYARLIIRELGLLNIKGIIFEGSTSLHNNVMVLGKGCTGIVVKAISSDSKVVALKIMRRDSNRVSVKYEANMLKIVNSIGIGPKVIDYTDHILMMEFIEGVLIKDWLNTKHNKEIRVRVIRDILEQCYRLDTIGVDHGELSNMDKHVIVSNNNTCIVDFESASMNRRVSNLTSAVQYLFLRNNNLWHIDRDMLIDALRAYKHDISREAFEELLRLMLN